MHAPREQRSQRRGSALDPRQAAARARGYPSPMKFLFSLLLLLVAPAAAAQAPDFTALVRDAGAAVVALSGGQSMVYADLPLAEDQAEEEEDEEPALLRDFLRRYYGPAPDVRALGSGFVI